MVFLKVCLAAEALSLQVYVLGKVPVQVHGLEWTFAVQASVQITS